MNPKELDNEELIEHLAMVANEIRAYWEDPGYLECKAELLSRMDLLVISGYSNSKEIMDLTNESSTRAFVRHMEIAKTRIGETGEKYDPILHSALGQLWYALLDLSKEVLKIPYAPSRPIYTGNPPYPSIQCDNPDCGWIGNKKELIQGGCPKCFRIED